MHSINSKNNIIVQWFIFLCSFFCYLHFLFPSLYGGDTGELIVSSHILGIPHAPGYPLFNIIGKACELLVPFGNSALRINLLGALLGAFTLVLFFRLMNILTGDVFASLLTVVYLGSMPIFFEQSLLAEVFMLNAFFSVAIICIMVSRGGDIRHVCLAFFLLGLALGNHHTIILIIPAVHCLIQPQKKILLFVLYVVSFILVFFTLSIGVGFFAAGLCAFYLAYPLPGAVGKSMGRCFLCMLAGLTVYMYLPLRARVDPVINFGNPETFKTFLDVVMRREFGSLTLHPAALHERSFPSFWAQVLGFTGTAVKHIGIPGILISFLGMREAVQRKKLLPILLLFVIPGPIFILYSNLSPSTLAVWRLERFFLIPDIALAILIGLGFVWILRHCTSVAGVSGGRAKAIGMLLLLVCAWPLDRIAGSRYHFFLWDFGNNILRTCASRASLIFDTKLFDEYASSVAYATQVEEKRKDISLISRSGTIFKNIYGDDFYYMQGEKRIRLIKKQEKKLFNETAGPVYYAVMDRGVLPEAEYRYRGLLSIHGDTPEDIYPFYIRRELFERKHAIADYPTRLIAVHYPYFKGKMCKEINNLKKADILFASCRRFGRDMEWLMYNIGALYSASGDLMQAEAYYLKALYLDPFFPDTYFGMGYVYFIRQAYQQAEYAFKQTIRLKPDFADAYYNLGAAQWSLGKKDSARESWKTFLAYKPDSPEAVSIKVYLK